MLLMPDGHAQLTDFGLVSTTETTAGTPGYMAPELLSNRPFNKSVDVYSFGVLLWELWAKQFPFVGWRPADLVAHVASGGRPDMAQARSMPIPMRQLAEQCWHADPRARPSAAEVVAKLAAWKPSTGGASRFASEDALDAMLK